ncbi:hypothetical protein PsYK624_133280 [Phanerochaete sordida]|uniref:Uncharacterized protein n=1 Tax=Phanerochaete sordida TaxID=48140 RepID=A0A9P3GKD6_9APHY|nr:hypothetical protein PsYK624_133280 [Phanerochaete sordida]
MIVLEIEQTTSNPWVVVCARQPPQHVNLAYDDFELRCNGVLKFTGHLMEITTWHVDAVVIRLRGHPMRNILCLQKKEIWIKIPLRVCRLSWSSWWTYWRRRIKGRLDTDSTMPEPPGT